MILKQNNSVLVTGNLPRSREPDVRYTQTGRKVVNFSVKGRSTRNEDGTYTDDWINCVAWGDMADICGRLHAGQSVLVSGSIASREWTGRDGDLRTSTELTVDFILGCGPVPPPSDRSAQSSTFNDLDDMDDDGELPF